jgi:four helix bundle protein
LAYLRLEEGDMRDFKGLRAWQKAHELVIAVYRSTGAFPRDELYGLTSQVRRGSVSIASNIAEGCGRRSQPEMAHFLHVAIGSANEVEYQLLLARDLGYLEDSRFRYLEQVVSEARRMITTLARKVERDSMGVQ